MGFNPNTYKKVSGRRAAGAGGTLIRNVDEFSVRYARRYVDTYGFLLSIRTTKINGPSCAAIVLFERDAELSFQVAPASWEARSPRPGASARTTEHTLKKFTEVAKATAIFQFHPLLATPIHWR